MRHFLINFIFLFVSLMPLQGQQTCDHSTTRTQNLLIPNFRFTVVPRRVTDNSAVSILGEVGRRNYRFSGTFGAFLGCNSLFKVTGEYLQQKLGYNFRSGKSLRWMRQYAIGTTFRHTFCDCFISDAEINGFYSFAPGHHLGSKACVDRRIFRHIAGSSGYGFSIGAGFIPWQCAHFQIDANYDNIIYHRKFKHNNHVEGFGGCVDFYQKVFSDFGLGLRGEFRRPFNYYKASLNWTCPSYPELSIGIFGSHFRGKSKLPSNTSAGIELSYIIGDYCCRDMCCDYLEGIYNPFAEADYPMMVLDECDSRLKAWTSQPAVYLPEVLAIAEEQTCRFVSSTAIPSFTFTAPGPFAINIAPFFNSSGGPLAFSAVGLPLGASIDPVTGIITGINLLDGILYTVTVTGAGACSSTSQTFTIFFAVPCTGVPLSSPIPPQSFCSPNPYSFNAGAFFTNAIGGTPFVFSATGLPAGSVISSTTGVISGPNLQNGSVNTVTVTATSSCGSTSQTFTISFPCLAPTSTTIPDFATTQPTYTYDVHGFFTSPCGHPFTFSATGLPSGSSINAVTGVISGPSVFPGGPFTVTVTGTTACGSTPQTFTITFISS